MPTRASERSLAAQLLAWILPFIVAVSAVIAFSSYRVARSVILEQLSQRAGAAAGAAAAQVEGLWSQYRNDAVSASQSPLLRDYVMNSEFGLKEEAASYRREIERMLLAVSRRSGAFPRLRFLDARGREVCRVQDGALAAPSPAVDRDLPGWPPPADGRLAVSAAHAVAWHRFPVVTMTAGVLDDSGKPGGLLAFDASLGPTYEALQRFRIGRSGRARLELTGAGQESSNVAGEAPVAGTPWSVALTIDRGEFTSPLARVAAATAGLTLVAVLVLAAGLSRQLRYLLKPIGALADAAGEFARGRLDARVEASGPKEVAALGEAFNGMAGELERRTAELVEAEKLSTAGRLIGGISHELNNPLTAVTGFAELLRDLPGTPEQREDMRLMHANAVRCRDIIQGMLSFVRRSPKRRERVSLNELAQSSVALMEYRLVRTEGIELDVELDPAAPAAAGDFTSLQQALVNLLENACDALRGRQGRRRLRIWTRAAAGSVELGVEDNGPGVPAELREKVFEPFYTTKAAGAGTGLGLWIAAQSVRDFGGTLRCEAGAAGGARLVAVLPSCPEGFSEARPSEVLCAPRPGARVLIVDDEPELARVMERLLSGDGQRVVCAGDGPSALRAIAEQDWDLVIADVNLGAVKGPDLFEEARRLGKTAPFLFVTGDVFNDALLARAAALGAPVLAKPFLRTDFLRATRRALAGETSPA